MTHARSLSKLYQNSNKVTCKMCVRKREAQVRSLISPTYNFVALLHALQAMQTSTLEIG